MPILLIAVWLLASLMSACLAQDPDPLDASNVVWDSPSADAAGSMPIGNGDIGLNVWAEADGDLLFLIGKTDSWSENARLLKLGRVRVKLSPNPFGQGLPFRQTLRLRQGEIENAKIGCAVAFGSTIGEGYMFTREASAEALITVVTRNRTDCTARCLAALEAMDEPEAVHLVIVDNGSDRPVIDWLKLWTYRTRLHVKRLVLLDCGRGVRLDPHNVAAAVNLGWVQSPCYPIRVKLDNDILLPPDWLARTRRLIYAGYGLVGWVPCSESEVARGFLPAWQTVWNNTFRGYHYIFGGCACVSQRWFEKVGYWHEGYRRGIDFEYSIRGQLLGEMITYVKDACAVHVGIESADDDLLRQQAYQEARLRFDLSFGHAPQPYMTRWLTRCFSQNRFLWQVAE